MTEQEIRKDYVELFAVNDDSKKSEALKQLHAAAEKLGLTGWMQLIDARLALVDDQYETATQLSTDILDNPAFTPDLKAMARVNRGSTYRKKGETDKAIADHTAVIEDPSSPADMKAQARFNCGVAYGQKGETDKAIADYTAVIEDLSSPADQKAQARFNRGLTYTQKGETDKGIADYTAVIEDPSSPADPKGMARVNRGFTYGQKGETDKGIADYTAVIEDPSSPADQKAKARVNRGVTYGQKGETDKAIADYTAVIEDPSSPAYLKAQARANRGVTYGQKGETDKAIADYTAVIEDPSSPPEVKEKAQLSMHFLKAMKGEAAIAVGELPVAIDATTRKKFQDALRKQNRRMQDFFSESIFDDKASFLLILREWNSYTPAIPGDGERVRGGGYFIKHKETGIVIDPGFNFLEIFSEAGGRLCDITHIVITHAHNDHTADFESILTLLYEFNDEHVREDAKKKKVKIHMSQGAARKFAGFLPLKNCPYIDEIVTLNRGRKETPQIEQISEDVLLTVLPAYHDDVITKDYSIGIGLDFQLGNGKNRRLLFTGDTALFGEKEDPIHANYPIPFCEPSKTDLLIAHIGSIEEVELEDESFGQIVTEGGDKVGERRFKPVGKPYEKHLGLRGVFAVLYDLQPRAAVVSEFGEEMQDIRIEAVRVIGEKLAETLKDEDVRVFAGDPVVIYNIHEDKFLCHGDLQFREAKALKMVGLYEGRQGTERPYLFLKEDVIKDISPFEGKITTFHTKLKDRKLPYF